MAFLCTFGRLCSSLYSPNCHHNITKSMILIYSDSSLNGRMHFDMSCHMHRDFSPADVAHVHDHVYLGSNIETWLTLTVTNLPSTSTSPAFFFPFPLLQPSMQ